ncbi:unnamed protein product [Coffea canephora]|uniref:Uncharacterized protein n=1 Tax=Coffea canephora TaxID=49390 RepID=A0A068TXU7_COFCA|nr:unnamed protein product [Coffea canephora]
MAEKFRKFMGLCCSRKPVVISCQKQIILELEEEIESQSMGKKNSTKLLYIYTPSLFL